MYLGVGLCENSVNKKVLLRERKRHTARHVVSARYAALSNGGYSPHHPDLAQGYPRYPPPSRPGWGTPLQEWGTLPLSRLVWGTPPPHHPDLAEGTHPPRHGMGYPLDLGQGTPPPQMLTDRHL